MSDQNHSLVSADALKAFCRDGFVALGLSAADAEITSDSLVMANLRGVDSHGVIRMKIYVDRLRLGSINPRSPWRVLAETPTTALVDGGCSPGQVTSFHSMRLAIQKAEEAGIGMVGVFNSGHFGTAAYYTMMAAARGLIGIASTNTSASMPPWGGRKALLGNNPISIAAPAEKYPSVVFDIATGAVAWGKIFVAQQEKKKIPTTWALDKHGRPTDDPDVAADGGMIQPFGGYKGYGLGFMLDVLTGVLTGGGFSDAVRGLYKGIDQPINAGHFFMAIRIESFIPLPDFRRRMDQLIEGMRGCPTADGFDRIYTPGEIEQETEQKRRREGIPINPVLREELIGLATSLGVKSPF